MHGADLLAKYKTRGVGRGIGNIGTLSFLLFEVA